MLQDILLFLVGIITGGMNAVAGGGILLGFPILLAVGVPALVANISSNIIVMPGQMSSVYAYRKYLRKIPPKYLLLLIPCALGAAAGALVLRNTPSRDFAHLVPGLILFAVVLFAFQPFVHHQLHRHIHHKTNSRQTLFLIAVAVLPLAFYGGYFGAGFGFIMLAFLGFTSLHDIHQMNGLKNLAGLVIAVVSLVCLFSTGLIDWHRGLVMGGGNLVGGYCGAVLAQKFSSHAIRILVIVVGLFTTAYLALHAH